jgi:hypothetical protein
MAIETLLDLAKADSAVTEASRKRASDRLKATQDEIGKAAKEKEVIEKDLKKATDREREIVGLLEAYATEAEGADLIAERRGLVIEIRGHEAGLASIAENTARWSRQATVFEQLVRRLEAERDAAIAAEEAEKKEAALPKEGDPPRPPNRAVVRKLLGATKLPAALGATGNAVSRAGDRVFAGLPDALKDRARARADERAADLETRRAAITAAEADLLALATTNDGPAAVTRAKQAAFDRADAEARAYALGGQERMDAIVATFAVVAGAPELTAVERGAVKKATTGAAAGLDLEQKLADATVKLRDAEAKLATAIRAAMVADPDVDPATDAAVQAEQAKADAAAADVATAKTNYSKTDRGKVDLVEEALPDHRWRALQQYEAMRAELDALKAVVPTQLLDRWAVAEKELVEAIQAERVATRGRWLVDSELGLAAAAVEASAAGEQARTFSAIRGDG